MASMRQTEVLSEALRLRTVDIAEEDHAGYCAARAFSVCRQRALRGRPTLSQKPSLRASPVEQHALGPSPHWLGHQRGLLAGQSNFGLMEAKFPIMVWLSHLHLQNGVAPTGI